MPKKLSHEHLIGLFFVLAVLGALAWIFATAKDEVPGIPEVMPIKEAVTQEACEAQGGNWNPCASACPDAGPDTLCIQVCVEKCEF